MINGELLIGQAPITVLNEKGCAVVESIKKAENSNDLVVRMVEKHGRNAAVKLQIADNSKSAYEVDMLEWNDGEKVNGNTLTFTPFEIKTIIIK